MDSVGGQCAAGVRQDQVRHQGEEPGTPAAAAADSAAAAPWLEGGAAL